MNIQSISIERFKGIPSLDLDLKPLTMIIGGNNSGKSSLLQAIHFAVTTIQSTKMLGTATLASDQLIFKPTNDPMLLHQGSAMTQRSGPRFQFTYVADGATEAQVFDMGVKERKECKYLS